MYGPRDVPGTVPPPDGSRVDVHSCAPSIFANSCFSAMRTTRGIWVARSRSPPADGLNTRTLPVSSREIIEWPCRNMWVTVCACMTGRIVVMIPDRTSTSNK